MLQRNGGEATQTVGGGCMGFSCLLRWKELLLHCAAKSDGPSEGLGGLPTAIAVHSAPEGLVFSLLLTRSKQARPYAQPVRRPRSPATMGPIFRFVFSPRTIPTGVIAVSHSTARSPVHHKTSREEHLLRHVNTIFDRKVDPPGRSSSVEPAAGPFCSQRGAYACGFGPERGPCRRNRHKGSGPVVGWPPQLVGSATQSDLSNRREKTTEERWRPCG